MITLFNIFKHVGFYMAFPVCFHHWSKAFDSFPELWAPPATLNLCCAAQPSNTDKFCKPNCKCRDELTLIISLLSTCLCHSGKALRADLKEIRQTLTMYSHTCKRQISCTHSTHYLGPFLTFISQVLSNLFLQKKKVSFFLQNHIRARFKFLVPLMGTLWIVLNFAVVAVTLPERSCMNHLSSTPRKSPL